METVMLSFDTSTKSTGCAIWKNAKLCDYILIDSKFNKDKTDRVKYMVNSIFELINKYKPEIIVAELTVVTRNPQVQRDLSMILGAIMGRCISEDIFWQTYRPTEWRSLVHDNKSMLPRKRSDLKVWACEKVLHEYDLNVIDDVAEAILIGQAYINQFT